MESVLTKSVNSDILNLQLTKSVKSIKEVIPIYESFENLDESKKITIINAGFKVFGESGYKKASAEDITKEAGISKGSLFYYFGSKKNFYLYLYDYSIIQLMELINHPGPDGQPAYLQKTDFFERLMEVRKIKLKYSIDYPYFSLFAKRTVIENDTGIHSELQNKNQRAVEDSYVYFFKDLDTYKFKDGIDPKMVLQLIAWVSEGCANQILINHQEKPPAGHSAFDFNELITLYDSYLKLIRDNFYKEEYL